MNKRERNNFHLIFSGSFGSAVDEPVFSVNKGANGQNKPARLKDDQKLLIFRQRLSLKKSDFTRKKGKVFTCCTII